MANRSLAYSLIHSDPLASEFNAIGDYLGIFGDMVGYPGPALNALDPYATQTEQIYAGFRDADADRDGISSLGTIQDSLPPDFDATTGASGTALSKPVRFDTSGFNSDLNTSGSVRFEVPVATWDAFPSTTRYWATKPGGEFNTRSAGSGYSQNRLPEDADDVRVVLGAGTRVGVMTETFMRIVCSWDASNVYYDIDGLIFDRARVSPDPDSNFNQMYAVGLTVLAGFGEETVMRNFEIHTGAPDFTVNPNYGKIVFFGDSFTTQGAISASQVGHRQPYWDPGYGFQSGGAPSTGGSYASDTGMICSFFRECFRGGLIPGSSNHNDAESGDSIAACKTRAETWFASNTAQVAVVQIGTNNVSGSAFSEPTKATMLADYKLLIDAAIAGSCDRIVVANVASLRNDPTHQNSTHDDNLAHMNDVLIPAIVSYNPRCVLADVYTAMGSNTPTSDLFQSGNLHPSSKGQHVFGRTLGQALMGTF